MGEMAYLVHIRKGQVQATEQSSFNLTRHLQKKKKKKKKKKKTKKKKKKD
jgi:hypothetical protein